MKKSIYIDISEIFTRVVVLENGDVTELYIENNNRRSILGNIYLGRVNRILPGMESVFVDVGLEKDAFLFLQDMERPATGGQKGASSPEANTYSSTDTHGIIARLAQSKSSCQVKQGQKLIVQITREPMEMKGARVTTNIALPARFIVLLPTVTHIGVSKRIEDEIERQRLKQVVEELLPEKMGAIIRTAAEGCERSELEEDISNAIATWKHILKTADDARPPQLLHRDIDPVFRVLRDIFDETVDSVFLASRENAERCREYVSTFAPDLTDRIKLYRGSTPLFHKLGIERVIEKALKRKIWLPSGGYLIIDHTEALVAIDVNTGRYVGKTNLEETVFQTNLEAAREIGRQLRLRGIGGLIIIDFIDMNDKAHRERIIEELHETFKNDRAKVFISPFTTLGLVQITRKRIRRSLLRSLKTTCPCCQGTGYVKHPQTVVFQIIQKIESLFPLLSGNTLEINVNPSVKPYLDEHVEMLRKTLRVRCRDFYIHCDDELKLDEFHINTF